MPHAQAAVFVAMTGPRGTVGGDPHARGRVARVEDDGYVPRLVASNLQVQGVGEILAPLELHDAGVTRADARRHVEYLEELPQLVEEYLRDLPDLVEGPGTPIQEYETVPPEREPGLAPGSDGPLPIYTLTPECIRYRTPEEREKLREKRERERAKRYGAAYAMLGLEVVAHHNGSLEIAWRGGGHKLSGLRR
jgi:hypothetical protein